MHILMDDPIADLRALQARFRAGLLTHDQFKAEYAKLDAATAKALCDNDDGRIATTMLQGRALCSACAVIKLRIKL